MREFINTVCLWLLGLILWVACIALFLGLFWLPWVVSLPWPWSLLR
jgi:hypothetical protein